MTESRAQNVRGRKKIEEGIVGPPNRRAAKRELESKVFTKKVNRSRTWTWIRIRRTRWPARSVGGRTGIQEQQVLEAEQLVRVKAQLAVALVQQLREARVLAAELQRAARATHRVDHVVGLHGQRSSSGSTQSKYELFTIYCKFGEKHSGGRRRRRRPIASNTNMRAARNERNGNGNGRVGGCACASSKALLVR